jgi:hypothetical protein
MSGRKPTNSSRRLVPEILERGGPCRLSKLRPMGIQGVAVHMKGVRPWLVRWACRSRTRDFSPALAALVGPVKNIFYLIVHYFTSLVPLARQAGQAVVLRRPSLKICFRLVQPPPPTHNDISRKYELLPEPKSWCAGVRSMKGDFSGEKSLFSAAIWVLEGFYKKIAGLTFYLNLLHIATPPPPLCTITGQNKDRLCPRPPD